MESLPQDLVLHMATQLHPWDILSLSCTNRALHGALADIVLPAGRCTVATGIPLRSGGAELQRMVPKAASPAEPCPRARVRQCFPGLPVYDGPAEKNTRFGCVRYAFTLKANDLADFGGLLCDVDVPVAVMTIVTTAMFDRMCARIYLYALLSGPEICFGSMRACPRTVDFHQTDLTTVPAHFWDTYTGTTIFHIFDAVLAGGHKLFGILCYENGAIVAAERREWSAATSIDHVFARACTLHLSQGTPPPIPLLCTRLSLRHTDWRGHGLHVVHAHVWDCALEPRQIPNVRSLQVWHANMEVHGFQLLEELTVAGLLMEWPVHSNPRLHTLLLCYGAMPRTGPGNTALHEILTCGCTHSDRVPTRCVDFAANEWHYTPSAYTMYSNALHQF